MMRRAVFFCTVMGFAQVPSALQAQAASATLRTVNTRSSAERFDHWQLIENTAAEFGGLAQLDKATSAQATRLADQLLQRGQAYVDLYELQRTITRDYTLLLDSVADEGGPRFAATTYFRARALHESGRTREAAAAYRRATLTAPASLRATAAAWAATIGNAKVSPNATWQQAYVQWRAGGTVPRVVCAPAQRSCQLFQAIVTEDMRTLVRLQREISHAPLVDFAETQRGRDGEVTVEFSDPMTFHLLGVADFVLAAHVGLGRRDAEAWRGFALLRAGKPSEAAPLFRALMSSNTSRIEQFAPLLGEAEYRISNRAKAEQEWAQAGGAGLNMLVDVKSGLGLDSAAVVKQWRAEKQRGLERFLAGAAGGTYLARALLRWGLVTEAEEVLAAVRPASHGSRLTSVAPSVLVLAAHTEYRRGQMPNFRDRYSFARADLAGLASAAPVVSGMLRQLQQLTMTVDAPAVSRSDELQMPEEMPDA
ncbi:MAG: hypothetical protein IT353_09905 [Gemmatimonadaceae bacterium]|nr:hypothetical protein [Gemmatimonadaceae bacterium]